MDISSTQIEAIVRQVVASMGTGAAPKAAAGSLPKVAKVAMLVDTKKIEIQEVPLPELGEDDILIKVEGAGICGTDVHEWKMDPFGLMPVVLGHEGTGEVVYCGKNIDNLSRFAKAVETTIFVKNAPSYAGIGFGGEGHTTFTIGGPTGEGITSAKSFTRLRRCVMADHFRII